MLKEEGEGSKEGKGEKGRHVWKEERQGMRRGGRGGGGNEGRKGGGGERGEEGRTGGRKAGVRKEGRGWKEVGERKEGERLAGRKEGKGER